MTRAADLTGNRYGRMTVMARSENTAEGRTQWLCLCDCGNTKVAQAVYLKRGNTKSCGCLGLEQRKAAAQSQCHPFSRTQMYRERKSWENMLARCYEPSHRSYADYGGRGVQVCREWRESFEAFVGDMGARPTGCTLDRVDNDKGYSPDNCRWATRVEQANNRRNNRIITIGSESLTVAQWARRTGTPGQVIRNRLRMKWDESDAIFRPVGHKLARQV